MSPEDFVDLAKSVWGENWRKPLSRQIGRSPRMVRFYASGERSIPRDVADELRKFAAIGPAGTIIRTAVKTVMPKTSPISAHMVAQKAVTDLNHAGLLKEE